MLIFGQLTANTAISSIIIVQALHALGDPRLRLKARGCNPDARFWYLLRWKKVRTSVRARRFVRACLEGGSYKSSAEEVKVG